MLQTSRRSFLLGFASLLAAPALVRATSIMPVKPAPPIVASAPLPDWLPCDGRLIRSADYPELFRAIGGGETTFQLPDLRADDALKRQEEPKHHIIARGTYAGMVCSLVEKKNAGNRGYVLQGAA